MDRDPQLKRPYCIVENYGQGGIATIVLARSKEEILDRFPMVEVLDGIPAYHPDNMLEYWHQTAKDIDDPNLTDVNLFGRIYDD